MVARKPLPENARLHDDPTSTAPADVLQPGVAPQFPPQHGPEESVWRDQEATRSSPSEEPSDTGLGYGRGVTASSDGVPADVPYALRPGGPGVTKHNTNPFKRKPAPASAVPAVQLEPPTPRTGSFSQLSAATTGEASNNPWQPALEEKRQAMERRQEPLVVSNADERELGTDVWQSVAQAQDRRSSPTPQALRDEPRSPELMSFAMDEDGSPAWGEVGSGSAAAASASVSAAPALPPKAAHSVGGASSELSEDMQAWDDEPSRNKGKGPAVIPDMAANASQGSGWNLMDNEPMPTSLSRQSTWENFDDEPSQEPPTANSSAHGTARPHPDGAAMTAASSNAGSDRPPLPPRSSDGASGLRESSGPEPGRNETYQIKNINWFDANATTNPRTSPILVQNANGPCPLVALVNALSLSTPAETQTALTDTLRSREQISLTLLLDAVFDELMSPRRMSEDTELPDVTELYDFLKGLHTGMNVNPRFVPTAEMTAAFKRTSLTHMHPTQRSDGMIPGTFEDTREMMLYSTFAVPLIHGWIPSQDDMAYDAFRRRAESYEDAQNLLFREEELEEKLLTSSGAGLTEEEQGLYQDIVTIKEFLSGSATQLTRHGLQVIAEAMKPGSVAILFRNDHFSTLYRHPQTLQIFTLVTDAGFAGHAEIVWESLVDMSGERAEFFSGDFRVVGGAAAQQDPDYQQQQQQQERALGGSVPKKQQQDQQQQHQQRAQKEDGGATATASSSGEGGSGFWQSIRGRLGSSRNASAGEGPSGSSSVDRAPNSPLAEQEDHDLALAMQLQEEEDERHREEQRRRERESLLSEQYIEQHTQGARRQSTATANSNTSGGAGRRNSSGGGGGGGRRVASSSSSSVATAPRTQVIRPLIPPVTRPAVSRPADENATEEAPPTYEQASKQEAYIPPEGHPSHPASSPRMQDSPVLATSGGGGAGGGGGGGGVGGSVGVGVGGGGGRVHATPVGIRPVGMRPGAGRLAPGAYPQSNGAYRMAAGRGGPQRPPVPVVGGYGGPPPKERDCIVM